ncbi:MAG TPA: PD-(D/E)XK nuclease family protein, partial [Bacillota bacterium]|nr:PD-(D/E)XK nuclease family protein [Bacillota bacterium]
EAMELGYFSLEEINSHLQEDYLYILESLEQLTLVFSKFSEHENRLPDLELHRDIIRIAYHYTVKEKSHLKTLDVLDYAKAEYDYQTYFLERDDHDLLYATYHSSVNRYHHQFSGINQEDLDHLIASHNTLTGAKIESYHLCKFQYLMKYLLKLGRNEPSIHTFLGSLTHKVFEEALKENHEPINDIIAFHLDFPEDEKYKEKVFRNALTEEIKKLLPIFLDFHEQTSFNFVETEISFSIPMDGFQLTGTIDKAMILKTEEDKEYVVVVDYKISDKDFQISDFESGRYLQLPVYLYAFINQSHRKIIPAGLFYQPTGLGRYKKETNAILRHFKMKGIGLRSQSVMQKL